jgi:hypothetical protein
MFHLFRHLDEQVFHFNDRTTKDDPLDLPYPFYLQRRSP